MAEQDAWPVLKQTFCNATTLGLGWRGAYGRVAEMPSHAENRPPAPGAKATVVVLSDGDESAAKETVRYVRAHSPAGTDVQVQERDTSSVPADGDVVILAAGSVVGDGWLPALGTAAYVETTVATATALSIAEVDLDELGLSAGEAVQRVRAASSNLPPRILACDGVCTYVRRTTLELVGDEGVFVEGREDFSARCLLYGLVHVVAQDVVVLERGSVRALRTRIAPDARGVEADEPFMRAVRGAARALRGVSVTIDARCLGEPLTGTQVHVLELIAALVRQGQIRLRVLLPDRMHRDANTALAAVDGFERLVLKQVLGAPRTDVAHRPYQVFSLDDVALLHRLGERVVVTHQDLIAYANAGYFPSQEEWLAYRSMTRSALRAADETVFFSEFAAREAAAEGAAAPCGGHVVYVGTDHHLVGHADPEQPEKVDEGEFLLCIGTDFVHKNRVFALRVLEQLAQRHRWKGRLVFAGPRMPSASSFAAEQAFLDSRPALAERVVNLGSVPEGQKRWLLEHAALVLYPSVVEGFGLVPFEAAQEGTPCLFVRQAALAETLPPSSAGIVAWDAAATADRAAELLQDRVAREQLVDAVNAAGRELTWDASARGLRAVYEDVAAASPRRPEEVAAYAPTLIRAVDLLVPQDVQHVLVAIGRRRRLRGAVFGTVSAAHRAGLAIRSRR